MRFAEAKDDCDSALKLELNVKTLLRRGTSWLGLQEIDSARKDFKHVLSLEPNNRCDNHLLLTMDYSAACVALNLFYVTVFMLGTLKWHNQSVMAWSVCKLAVSGIQFCRSDSNYMFNQLLC